MRNDRTTGARLLLKTALGGLLPLALLLMVGGCSGDAGETDTGGVELVVSEFDGYPSVVSVNNVTDGNVGLVSVEETELTSLVENPNLDPTDLQTIELRTYEIRFTRADAGTRIPTPLVEGIFSTVPPGGTASFNNLPILRSEQLLNPPLSDLLFVNGGFDQETGSSVIKLNLHMRFFGRTLGGREVVTSTQNFTVEFAP